MNIQITIVAGEVLLLLEEQRRQLSLMEIYRCLGKPMRFINLAVGRLLREGLIDMETKNNNYRISRRYNDKKDGRKDSLMAFAS
ncbi:MAG: winged helix-turn-helix domain-containing protein [Planctomycetota bacterium]|nr:winged helix-turn-helix domain-containing protein [Planctomycetota bacterium]